MLVVRDGRAVLVGDVLDAREGVGVAVQGKERDNATYHHSAEGPKGYVAASNGKLEKWRDDHCGQSPDKDTDQNELPRAVNAFQKRVHDAPQ